MAAHQQNSGQRENFNCTLDRNIRSVFQWKEMIIIIIIKKGENGANLKFFVEISELHVY